MQPTRKLRFLALLVVLAAVPPAHADAPAAPDVYLGLLAGRWDFDGTLRGKPVHYHVEGRWVLANGWMRLALVDAARPPGYRADVYLGFDDKEGDYIIHWLDQFGAQGARVVGSGKRQGQKLVVVFPYAWGAFRDTFDLAADGDGGTLLLESQEKDGSWSTFASYTLKRRH